MRIATVLAVAAAYGTFVDALTQDEPGHPMLRDLGTDENQSQLVPSLFLMADNPGATCSWGSGLSCDIDDVSGSLTLGDTCILPVPVPTAITTLKLFYEDSPSDNSGSCFDSSTLAANVEILKTNNPFPTALQTAASGLEPVLNAKAKWCCNKYVELKEQFVQYTCGVPIPPLPTCVGGSGNTCGLDKCLKVTGNDIATVLVSIDESVQTASAGVIAALASPPADADETKNVYYSLPCTNFDATNDACKYNVKLSELVDVTPDWNAGFPSSTEEVDDFIFWRYNLDGGEWIQWDRTSDSQLAFTQPGTTVTIEAWTAAGQVGTSYSFNVNLYVHSTLTCANFDAMWTGVGVTEEGGAYCNVPGSDFTLLNFAYDAAQVVPHGAGTVTGDYAGATCEIMLKDEDSTVAATTTATLIESTATTLSKDFAVELVHDPNTAQKTAGKIVCTFTRTSHSNTMMLADVDDPNTITCTHDFTVTDCDAPELEVGVGQDAVCSDECAGDSAPGVGEACGGTVVTSNGAATSVSSVAEVSCCAACSPALTCSAVSDTEVKSCNAEPSGLLLAQLAAAEQKVFASETTTALLGASAMVAVVALVVVKRRADAAAHARESEDAYYPLLE
ncbi:unnamed protein product [Phytophthora lilii]|uniref:Unnamed protein product n=1 Tax=Phytophthora lilii TaxID=2077276 RepID=A0A9W6THQ6_9STRA|nr:unnamed protein product [Phytophthora lilii]